MENTAKLELYEQLLKDRFKIDGAIKYTQESLKKTVSEIVYEKYKKCDFFKGNPLNDNLSKMLRYKLEKVKISFWSDSSDSLHPIVDVTLEYFCNQDNLTSYYKGKLKKLKIQYQEEKDKYFYVPQNKVELFVRRCYTLSLKDVLNNRFSLEIN